MRDATTLALLQKLPLDGGCDGFCLSDDRRTLVHATLRDVRVCRVR